MLTACVRQSDAELGFSATFIINYWKVKEDAKFATRLKVMKEPPSDYAAVSKTPSVQQGQHPTPVKCTVHRTPSSTAVERLPSPRQVDTTRQDLTVHCEHHDS